MAVRSLDSPKAGAQKPRPVLRTRPLIAVFAVIAAATVAFFVIRSWLPPAWSTPGSSPLYLVGLVGAALSLTPFAFSLAKRSGWSDSPPAWFVAHVVAGCMGIALLFVHSGLQFGRPPALLLAAGFFLTVQGIWARIYLPYRIAGTFGSKYRPFLTPSAIDTALLAETIAAKGALLQEIDPAASEGVFSPTLAHWIRHPLLTKRYVRLAREEMQLIGQRRAVPAAQAYWRAIHIAVAFLFLLGLVIHVVTVTFFAGYVANGGPITWWHITAWGAPGP